MDLSSKEMKLLYWTKLATYGEAKRWVLQHHGQLPNVSASFVNQNINGN